MGEKKMKSKQKLIIRFKQKGLNGWKAIAPNGAVVKGGDHI